MSVIGADQRTLVTNFNAPGLNSVVALDSVRVAPTANLSQNPGVGSAIQIGPDFFLTAGHNVFATQTGVANAGGRIIEGGRVSSVPSRPTTGLTPADINFTASDVTYPDDYDDLSGVASNSTAAFSRDIAVVQTSTAFNVGTVPIGMVAFMDPLDARNYAITTAGFPAGVRPGSGSVNNGTVVGQTASGLNITEALLGFQSSGTIASVAADGRFFYSDTVDTEAGQSGSGVWTTIDTGSGLFVPAVLGTHISGGGRNGGHLITKDEYDVIVETMEAVDATNGAALPMNFIIGQNARAGVDGSETIIGSYRMERIVGQGGADVMEGRGGDDRLEGGAGVDQARFSDVITNYTLEILDATDPNLPSLRIDHSAGGSADGVDVTVDVEFAVFDWDDADADGVDDDGNALFVPLLADPEDPTKLRDGETVTYAETIEDPTDPTASIGSISAEVPAFMFDGDVDYRLTIGGTSSVLFNFVYIVDSSGSMIGTNITETKAAYQDLTQSLIDSGVAARSNFAVVDFDSFARLFSGLDAQGAIDTVNRLVAGGGTNFGPALLRAEEWFESINSTRSTNIAFFLSDGEGSGASDALQLVNEDQGTPTPVDVRAFGIGFGADLQSLNIIDSNNAVQLTDPADLRDAFAVSGFSRDVIERVDVKLGGAIVDTIAPDALVDGQLGLTFEGSISGLEVTPTAENQLSFDVVFNDGTPTATIDARVTTGQTEIRQQSADGTRFNVSFSVNQADYTGAAESVDLVANGLDNTITLSEGENSVEAGGGDDRIILLGGTNTVDGGEGVDTVVFDRTRAESPDITRSGEVVLIGAEATLIDVEFIEFTDARISTTTLETAPVATLASSIVTVDEADAGAGAARLEITLSEAASSDVTLSFATRAASAEGDVDYTAASGEVTIAAGDDSAIVELGILDDTEVEGDEEYAVDLTLSDGATFADGAATETATVVIEDDDTLIAPSVIPDETDVEEGSGADAGVLRFSLDRSGLLGEETVTWTVAGSGDAPADASDFAGGVTTGQVAFAAGETSQTVEIALAGDSEIEGNETFTVSLSSSDAETTVVQPDAAFAILDDDTRVAIMAAGAVSVIEGAGTALTFTIERRGRLDREDVVAFAVSGAGDRPADAADFGGALPTGQVTFAPGEASKDITVTVSNDEDAEPDETFAVSLSTVSGAAVPEGDPVQVTIVNDDGATDGPDRIDGTNGDDDIEALGGDDTVDSRGGNDTVDGGVGDDSLVSGDGDDSIDGGDGDDTIKSGDGDDRIDGGEGVDVILGGNGNDVIRGGGGNDNIKPGRGDDIVLGGDGDDVVAGFRGDERFEGGEGNDRLLGSVDDDTLIGGAGDDRLWGGPGFDVFIFEERDFGRDTLPLDVRVGSDTLDFTAVEGLTRDDFTIRQVGANVVLEVADGGSLVMNGVRFGGLFAEVIEDRFDDFILL